MNNYLPPKQPLSPAIALSRLQTLCARGEKCPSDIRKKLYTWGVPKFEGEAMITRLLHDKFIDEERYARAFVRDKSRFGHWGRIKITQALQVKQIPKDIIHLALEELNEDGQQETLKNELAKKLRSVKGKSDNDIKTKLIRYGMSKGFEYDKVLTEVNRLIKAKDDE